MKQDRYIHSEKYAVAEHSWNLENYIIGFKETQVLVELSKIVKEGN